MKWIIRNALEDDVRALAAIDAAASVNPWSKSQFAEACINASTCRADSLSETIQLLESDDEICGFIVFSLVMDEGSVHNIAVGPSWQRRGMARLLLQNVLDTFHSRGAKRCLLEVRVSNVQARCLYDNFGFQADGVRKNYYPLGSGREDALLMSKSL